MRTIVCDKCGKIIRMVRGNQIIKDDPKVPEEPEPAADQREGTGDEAPAALADPPEEPAAGDGFKAVEVKLDPPKPSVRMITPETRKRIRELAKDGKGAREIAEITGVSVPTATKYMRG